MTLNLNSRILLDKTMQDVKKDDLIVNGGNFYKVLGRIDDLIFLSDFWTKYTLHSDIMVLSEHYGGIRTVKELEGFEFV